MSVLKVKKEVTLNDKKYEVSNFTIGDLIDVQNFAKVEKNKITKKLLEEKKQEIIKDYKLANQQVDVQKLLDCKVEDIEIIDGTFNISIVRYQLKKLLNRYQVVTDEEIELILNNEEQKIVEDLIESSIDLPEEQVKN